MQHYTYCCTYVLKKARIRKITPEGDNVPSPGGMIKFHPREKKSSIYCCTRYLLLLLLKNYTCCFMYVPGSILRTILCTYALQKKKTGIRRNIPVEDDSGSSPNKKRLPYKWKPNSGYTKKWEAKASGNCGNPSLSRDRASLPPEGTFPRPHAHRVRRRCPFFRRGHLG